MESKSENAEPANPFKWVDHVYCLNLLRSQDRRENMAKQFNQLPWPSQFVRSMHPEHEAFTRLIKQKNKVDMTAHNRRCYCIITDCIHPRRRLRLTEIAISMSHLNAYKHAFKNRDRWCLICEDDVVFIPNLAEILNQAVPEHIWITDQPVIVFLGTRNNPDLNIQTVDNFQIVKCPHGLFSNYCYLVNAPAIAVLIKHFYPINRPEDDYKRRLIRLGKIHSFNVTPGLVKELSFGVNGQATYRSLSRMSNLPKQLEEKINLAKHKNNERKRKMRGNPGYRRPGKSPKTKTRTRRTFNSK